MEPISLTGLAVTSAVTALLLVTVGVAVRAWKVTTHRLTAQAAYLSEELQAARWAASRDPLTGVLNRHGWSEAVIAAAETGMLRPDQRWLVLLDLDLFKDVNDTHGHLMGDRLLGAFARQLKKIAGPGGVVARLGGDEFALLCGDAALAAINSGSEPSIQLADGSWLSVSYSAGAVAFDPLTDITYQMAAADESLYRAKTQRGQCTLETFSRTDTLPSWSERAQVRHRDLGSVTDLDSFTTMPSTAG